MFFIDIAVPRDVDPEMNRVEGIFLYDIDDLQSVAAANQTDRAKEASAAEAIVSAEVERYQRQLSILDAVPIIRSLQQAAETMRQSELRKAEAGRLRDLSDEQWSAVEALTKAMMNKFLHPTLQAIKASAVEGDAAKLESYRATFDPQRAVAYFKSHPLTAGLSGEVESATPADVLTEGANSEEGS
jgi:glutamyl-tRNA reductase